MKTFNRNRSIIIVFFLLFGLNAAPAQADGYSLRLGHHNSHNNAHYSNNYGHGHHNYGHNYNYGYSYNYRQPNYYYQRKSHHNDYNRSSYSKPCHQVSKTVVDDYGEYHRIGGTMCYNNYGQGYIVKGSRYQLR